MTGTVSDPQEALESLRRTRDEILRKYPDASYLREKYRIIDVMQLEFPEDEEGEKIYQDMLVKASALVFS